MIGLRVAEPHVAGCNLRWTDEIGGISSIRRLILILEAELAPRKTLYEEYHPYGTSAYRSSASGVEVSARRYRYTGKERDDETGLYYYGARYYAAWLGRWTSADPVGIGADGPGLYNYTRGSPVTLVDPNGMETPPLAPRIAPPPEPPPPAAKGKASTERAASTARAPRTGIAPPSASATAGSSPGEETRAERAIKGTAKNVVGLALGILEGVAPLGWISAATHSTGDRDIEMGRGLGMAGVGAAEVALSLPTLALGIGLDLSLVGAALGVPITVVSGAMVAEGGADSYVGWKKFSENAAQSRKYDDADGAAGPKTGGGKSSPKKTDEVEKVKLTGGGKKVLGDPALREMKDMTVADAIRARGGSGANVKKVSSDLQQKRLGDVANDAAMGNDDAATAIKLVKQASKKGQVY